jgi:ATP-dependent DNA ligase
LEASLPDLIRSVKAQALEGLVAKQCDSRYEPGQRSGAWQKMRVNRVQEFVIGGYTVGPKNFDAVVFGYFDGGKLIYAGRTRSGFTPASRNQLFKRMGRWPRRSVPLPIFPRLEGTLGRGADCRKDEGMPMAQA